MARDALLLLDQLWPDEAVHVAGVSMGGFIAQKLAVLLVQQGRLASLCLLVASASYLPHLHLPLFVYDAASSFIFKGPPRYGIPPFNCTDLLSLGPQNLSIWSNPDKDASGCQKTHVLDPWVAVTQLHAAGIPLQIEC